MKLLQGLQKLKEGIETNNTDLIEEAYSLLTDEDINFPDVAEAYQEIETPPTQIHIPELEKEIRQRANVGSENVQSLEMDFTMDKKKTKAEKKDFVNNFDPGLDTDEEDGYDLINDNVKPVERTRSPHKNITVFCQDCQKNIEINPQFKRDPYFCEFIKLGQKCPIS
jgi:hypothetical protein